MLEEWKVRQRILNLGINRRDIEKWFDIFFPRENDLFQVSPQKLLPVKMFLDAGFKNPYLVEKIFEKCKDRSDVPCLQKVIEIYKGYKEEYMSLGMDELEAEWWVKVFDNKGKDYYRKGWKRPDVVIDFEERFEEVNRIVEEFLVDDLSKEEVFRVFKKIKGWIDYNKLQSFREKHQPGQHPILTFALLKTNKSFQEIKSRLQFYTALGLPSLTAQKWVAAELIYNKKLKEYQIATLFSAGIDNGYDAFEWLSEFPANEAAEWYSAAGPDPWPSWEAKLWKEYDIPLEIASAFWKVGLEWSSNLVDTIKKYGIEHVKELVPYLEKVAMSAKNIELWLYFDKRIHEMKDWIALGVNYYALADSLEREGFTPENLKDLLNYCSLEELLKEVQEGKNYEQVYKYFYDRHLKKASLKATLKQFRKRM